MADMVEATLDVTFQYPLWTDVSAAHVRKNIFTGILTAPSLSESERAGICRRFCHGVQCQRIERLHGPVIHRGNPKRAFRLFVLLVDVYPAEGTGFVVLIRQGQHRPHLLRRCAPPLFVDTGCVFPFVGGYFLDRQQFCVVRMRKQILQSFYCVPFLFFGRLSNPGLQPINLGLGFFPIYMIPLECQLCRVRQSLRAFPLRR